MGVCKGSRMAAYEGFYTAFWISFLLGSLLLLLLLSLLLVYFLFFLGGVIRVLKRYICWEAGFLFIGCLRVLYTRRFLMSFY